MKWLSRWNYPRIWKRFVAEAKAAGVQVSEVVRTYLYHAAPGRSQKLPTFDEIDGAFEEAASIIPEGVPPLSDEALSRESIYTREDDWNQ